MDYHPFGWEMPGRTNNSDQYRYGFNGKEKDQSGEWGSQTHYDYGFRIYNPAIARFLSVDPLTKEYPWYTPYQFAGNKPIKFIDLDGLEEALPEEEYASRRDNVQNDLETEADNLSGGSESVRNQWQDRIDHGMSSLEVFRDSRPMSTYSMLRYLEGEGGYDIYDIRNIRESFQFRSLYKNSISKIRNFSHAIFSGEKSSLEAVEYSPRKQGAGVLFSDFGTSIGSSALKYNIVLNQISEGEVGGTAYFTFVDTYRWSPERNDSYGIYGDHPTMFALQDLGASNFSIRSYFTVNFTITDTWHGPVFDIINAGNVENTPKTANHPEISAGAGYRLIPGGLKVDHTQ